MPSTTPASDAPDPRTIVCEVAATLTQRPIEELSETLPVLLDAARRIWSVASGTISLIDNLSNTIYVGTGRGDIIRRNLEPSSLGDQEFTREHHYSAGTATLTQGKHEQHAPAATLWEHKLEVRGSRIGTLVLTSEDAPRVSATQAEALSALAGLAALTIDRYRLHNDSPALLPWLHTIANVAGLGRRATTNEEANSQDIAEYALAISEADFVVLYEYFSEKNDVRLPAAYAGSPRRPDVFATKGVVSPHSDSTVFRLLRRTTPLYAERGVEDWLAANLANPATSAATDSFFEREGVRSSIGVPLLADTEAVGVLFLNFRRQRSFDRPFRERLQLFANCAAMALGTKRFLLRSARISRNLESLNRIGKALSFAIKNDIEDIGEILDTEMQAELPSKNFFLCLFDQRTEHFSLPYVRDLYDTKSTLEPRLANGLTARICRRKAAMLLTREQQQTIFESGEARLIGRQSAVWAGAPIILREEAIGALVVQDYEDESAFNDEHLQLLNAIASQAASAIDNHLLLDNLRRQLNELGALLTLAQAIGTGDLTNAQILSATLDDLCSFARCSGSLLLLVDPGNREQLQVFATSSSLTSYLGRAFDLASGAAGAVLETGKYFLTNNYAGWSRRNRLFDPPPRRVCAVPLRFQNQIIGALTLSSDSIQPLSQKEIEILQRLAGPIAVLIQNARDVSFRRTLIDTNPYAIVAVDRRGHITDYNSEAARLFGYTLNEVKHTSVANLYRGGLEEARRIQAQLKEHSVVKDIESFGVTRHGQRIPVSLSAAMLRDERGMAIGSVGIIEDLRLQALRTRMERLVKELRDISSLEELPEIARRVVLGAVSLLYADAGCLILFREGTFETTFQVVSGQSSTSLPLTAEVQETLHTLYTRDRKLIIFPIEEGLDILRLDTGSRSSVLVPVTTAQRFLAYVLLESRQEGHFSGDQQLLITLAAQAAVAINRVQLLRYREKMLQGLLVAQNAISVGQTAPMFLHEAKNSLNSISLLVQSLSEAIKGETALRNRQRYVDGLGTVRDCITRFGLIAQRLQRLTHKNLRPTKIPTFINPLVRRALQHLEGALKTKGVGYELRVDSDLDEPAGRRKGTPVLVDELQIEQVLMNLVLNAIAASDASQVLIIETHIRGDCVQLLVRDFGAGIDPSVRDSLFQPFFTTKPDGTGLGLYLSRILIEENHGGRIEILHNEPLQGTTFSVSIPL